MCKQQQHRIRASKKGKKKKKSAFGSKKEWNKKRRNWEEELTWDRVLKNEMKPWACRASARDGGIECKWEEEEEMENEIFFFYLAWARGVCSALESFLPLVKEMRGGEGRVRTGTGHIIHPAPSSYIPLYGACCFTVVMWRERTRQSDWASVVSDVTWLKHVTRGSCLCYMTIKSWVVQRSFAENQLDNWFKVFFT